MRRICFVLAISCLILFSNASYGLVINEILHDGSVSGDPNQDGSLDSMEDEFIELVNDSGSELDISGWTIHESDFPLEARHVFPQGTILPAGCGIVVFGGGNPNVYSDGFQVQVASVGGIFGLDLNDNIDTVDIRDGGGTLMATYSYNTSIMNQSLARYPDITGPDPLVAHSVYGVGDYSPGFDIIGGPFPGCALLTWYRDADIDGWGDEFDSIVSPTQPIGYVSQAGDCLDSDSTVHPGAIELIDGQDNDCDGLLYRDEIDMDADGFVPGAIDPGGWDGAGGVLGGGDCDDNNAMMYPGNAEICGDGIDNDCNGIIDDGLEFYYQDLDLDGHGAASAMPFPICGGPSSGWSLTNDDCDDSDSTIYPGTFEMVDGRDNDCDGLLLPDEIDFDGDGYIPGVLDPGGWDGGGLFLGDQDCDDTEPTVYPGAAEICGDGLDNDCDGAIDQSCTPFTISSIVDVGNDQGRVVRLTWLKSILDDQGSLVTVTGYGVYRRLAGPSAPATDKLVGWDSVGWVAAHGDSVYNYVSPTTCDSTAAGLCWSVFFVRATTTDPFLFIDSPPDSGYSLDNIAPGVPTAVTATYGFDGVSLDWDDASAADFQYYRIYRDLDAGFVPSALNLIHETSVSSWSDPATNPWGYHYKITVLDHAGNEGEAGWAQSPSGVEDGMPVRKTGLLAAVPNPFNPTTKLSFALASASSVRLAVYDVSGRLVKVLVDEHREIGRYEVMWDGSDTAGRISSAGVYLYRLEADGVTETKRILLVK